MFRRAPLKNKKRVWLSGAFYKQATPNGVTKQRRSLLQKFSTGFRASVNAGHIPDSAAPD
jgi:hypothetical protein